MKNTTGKKVVPCRGCGAPIFFEQGMPWFAKRVPILVEIDYQTLQPAAASGPQYQKTTGYVSHFVNCPKAEQFSGAKREEKRDNANG